MSFDGGYDDGYVSSRQFWGEKPANAVQKVAKFYDESVTKTTLVLDAGCGHGKNSIYLSNKGFKVDSFDASYYAIQEARERNQNVNWRVCDIRKFNSEKMYDIILMTGSLHCLHSKTEIFNVIKNMQSYTVVGGYNVLSAFNSGYQDMSDMR